MKAYIKVKIDTPPEIDGYYHTNEGILNFVGGNIKLESGSVLVSYWLKPIDIEEYMIGFAEWSGEFYVKCVGGFMTRYESQIKAPVYTGRHLLMQYLDMKGIVWQS